MLGLLAEWESMGLSRRPHLKDLLKHLLQADELAAASFISEKLLNEEEPITEENKVEKLDKLKDVVIIGNVQLWLTSWQFCTLDGVLPNFYLLEKIMKKSVKFCLHSI